MKKLMLALIATSLLATAGNVVLVAPAEAKCKISKAICGGLHDLDKTRREAEKKAIDVCKSNPAACAAVIAAAAG